MVQVTPTTTQPCDFTQAFAAIGSKRLPQEGQKAPLSISQNCPQGENGSIRLPEVLFGSNGLPKVFRIDAPLISQAAREAVTSTVASEPNITLDQLYKSAEGKGTRDDIRMMIAHEEIFVDLFAAPLPEPDLVRAFPDEETSLAYRNLIDVVHDSAAHKLRYVDLSKTEKVLWGNRSWTILNTNEETVGLLGW